MYQPYPGQTQMPEAQLRSAPAPVHNAVKAMYAGAVTGVLGIVIDVITVGAAIWIFLARSCLSGRNWARITAIVFLWQRASTAFFKANPA